MNYDNLKERKCPKCSASFDLAKVREITSEIREITCPCGFQIVQRDMPPKK